MRTLLLLLVLTLNALRLVGQADTIGYGIICTTRDTAHGAYRPAPAAFLSGEAEVKTQFILDFSAEVPAVAQVAFLFAANIWGSYLDSEIPVRVQVDWEDRDDDRLLASAGPGTLFRGFTGSRPNTWYPVALAEAITGRQLNAANDPDIRVNANSTANWYFGTDGNTPRNRIDLVSVVLHELGHGLGFLSSVDTINAEQLAIGFGGRFIVYDLFLETRSGLPLTDTSLFINPSEELLMAVNRNDLVFDGPLARRENQGAPVPLFAPPTFDVGSSVSHLNEAIFRPGTEHALMTPFLAAGESIHDPGSITLGIFADLGWPLVFTLTSNREVTTASTALKVYPNPATGRVTLELGPTVGECIVSIFASDGRLMSRQIHPGGNTNPTIPLYGYRPGVYHLNVQEGPRLRTARLVVR